MHLLELGKRSPGKPERNTQPLSLKLATVHVVLKLTHKKQFQANNKFFKSKINLI